jgi:hypothetical protein
MIIDDFDVLGTRIGPSETNPELTVDADAVLSFPVAFKGFQTIPGWYAKVLQQPRDFQPPKFAARHRSNIGKPLYRIALGQDLRIRTPEGFDHGIIITRCVINVKSF